VVGFINKQLQRNIPGQIGRYDDSYNPNCMGDYFQGQGTPTLLFECGQVGEDYERENTRKWFAVSLLEGLKCIREEQFLVDDYAQIPEVNKSFVDIIVKNARIDGKTDNIALQFKELLTNKGLEFIPIVHSIGNLDSIQAHKTVDFSAHKGLSKSAVLVGKVAKWAQF
ncbi:MAG: peptidase M14, partial [Flavobacteriaceae bacterium]